MKLLIETKAAACRMIRDGWTSAEIERQAQQQERDGFTVSAPFTRLLASAMREIERSNQKGRRTCN